MNPTPIRQRVNTTITGVLVSIRDDAHLQPGFAVVTEDGEYIFLATTESGGMAELLGMEVEVRGTWAEGNDDDSITLDLKSYRLVEDNWDECSGMDTEGLL